MSANKKSEGKPRNASEKMRRMKREGKRKSYKIK